MLNRRRFLSSSFASSLAAGASLAWRGNLWAQLESLPSKLPERSLFDQNEDAYWRELRKQFLIPADEIYLNNGTVGSSPAPVLRAVFEGYEACEKPNEADPEDSADASMRCAIATVNVPPLVRMDLEHWMWKEKKIRLRGAEPHKLRLSTP